MSLQHTVASAFLCFLGRGLIGVTVSIFPSVVSDAWIFLGLRAIYKTLRNTVDRNFSKDSFYLKGENNSPE